MQRSVGPSTVFLLPTAEVLHLIFGVLIGSSCSAMRDLFSWDLLLDPVREVKCLIR